jgi:hypothetical protein
MHQQFDGRAQRRAMHVAERRKRHVYSVEVIDARL